MRMLIEDRAASTAEGYRIVRLSEPVTPVPSVTRRDPQAVTALLAVLTVGLGSLLAIVGLWWAAG